MIPIGTVKKMKRTALIISFIILIIVGIIIYNDAIKTDHDNKQINSTKLIIEPEKITAILIEGGMHQGTREITSIDNIQKIIDGLQGISLQKATKDIEANVLENGKLLNEGNNYIMTFVESDQIAQPKAVVVVLEKGMFLFVDTNTMMKEQRSQTYVSKPDLQDAVNNIIKIIKTQEK